METTKNKKRAQILLVNDDGISSPGLWAAAKELSEIGYVTVAAPREQHSGAGRSVPAWSDGEVKPTLLKIGDEEWTCYSVGGSPAQSVQYGIMSILKEKPDLVVSGINYGENPSVDITLSGTVGAALEAASFGVPSLAVSMLLDNDNFYIPAFQVDFSTAAIFTKRFAKLLLEKKMPEDVMVLNVNVPLNATPDTPWRVTRLGRHAYFEPYLREPEKPGGISKVDARAVPNSDDLADKSTDISTLKVDHEVSVTPLSLDMTSRVNLNDLRRLMGNLD